MQRKKTWGFTNLDIAESAGTVRNRRSHLYLVTIIKRATREAIDSRAFAYGTWAEIGFWLDKYGYNDSPYEVKIQFGTLGGK